jgi:cystathionine gamma-synthase
LFGGALLAADPERLEALRWWSNAAGLNGPAFDAWQILRGLRTLPLRVRQMQAGAAAVAQWLAAQGGMAEVFYPGLAAHPDHDLARRQQTGPGFLLSFRLAGGAAAADAFVKALRLVTLASSLGGFSSLICRPATMTHRGMPPEAQAGAGITPDLLRLSVGLEDPEDLIADLARGLAAI